MDALYLAIAFGVLTFLVVIGGVLNGNLKATRASIVAPMLRLRTALLASVIVGGLAYLAGLWMPIALCALLE